MPTIVVPEPPFKTPMVDAKGIISSVWIGWVRQTFLRIGGNIALSNSDIETLLGADISDLQADVAQLQNDVAALQAVSEIDQGPVL